MQRKSLLTSLTIDRKQFGVVSGICMTSLKNPPVTGNHHKYRVHSSRAEIDHLQLEMFVSKIGNVFIFFIFCLHMFSPSYLQLCFNLSLLMRN